MKNHTLTMLSLLIALNCCSAQIDSTLMSLIKKNDVTKVDSLLRTNTINLDATDEHGANALMWACYHADSSMVAMMFDWGAKPPVEGGGIYYEGETTLRHPIKGWYGSLPGIAAGEGKDDMIRYLFDEQKFDVNQQVSHENDDSLSMWTPLMYAAHKENATTIHLLIDRYNVNTFLKNEVQEIAAEIVEDEAIRSSILKINIKDLLIFTEIKNNWETAYKYFQTEKYEQAAQIAKLNLNLIEEIYGINHILYGACLNNISYLYKQYGDYELALQIQKKALLQRQKTVGKKSRKYSTELNNLAGLYRAIGMLDKSLPLYLEALQVLREIKGIEEKSIITRLNNLGSLYTELGDYEKALPILKEALERRKKLAGQNNYINGLEINLTNLAVLYNNMGAYDDALVLLLEASDIVQNNLGKGHSKHGVVLNNLGRVYIEKKDYEQALKLFHRALENTAETLGTSHVYYGNRLYNLAKTYGKIGNQNKAFELLKECRINREETLGKFHPEYANCLFDLAIQHEVRNDYDASAKLYYDLLTANSKILLQRSSFLPSKSQEIWRQRASKYFHKANSYLSIHKELSIKPVENYNLQLKSSISNNIHTFKENRNDSDLYAEWLSLKKRIAKDLTKPISKRTPTLDSLQNKAEELEVFLLAENRTFRTQTQSITVDKLKNKLQKNEIIIDIVHFNYMNLDKKTDTIYYVAYLIPPNNDEIQQVKLFEEKRLLKALGTKSNNETATYANRGLKTRKVKLKDLSFIWEPMLPYLKKYDKIYISPSGLLNKINLGAIPIDDNKIVTDKFDLVQYNSMRSMLAEYEDRVDDTFLLVGGLDYDYQSDLTVKGGADILATTTTAEYVDDNIRGARSSINQKWNYLPGTAKEVSKIQKLAKNKKQPNQLLSGKTGSEEEIKKRLSQETSPKVVHFATHGFFYPDVEKDDKKSAFLASDNPMIRSGLILANANYAWQNGELAPELEEDGILTAYEVANLNLTNTELVVLSACETGLGEIQGSEGVFGLQRAFKIAGARYILMSLWQVPDEETSIFMTTFYKNWLNKNKSIPEAFAATQKKMRKKFKDPYLWAGFILVE